MSSQIMKRTSSSIVRSRTACEDRVPSAQGEGAPVSADKRNKEERSPRLRQTSPSTDKSAAPAVSLSTSLLDESEANLACDLALIIASSWAVNGFFESWLAGHLWNDLWLLRSSMPGLWAVPLINAVGGAFSTFAWLLPRAARTLGRRQLTALYVLGQIVMLLAPAALLRLLAPDYSPIAGLFVMMYHCVFIMKAHSYFFACAHDPADACDARGWLLFALLPTLCYRPRACFARTDRVRPQFVLSHATRCVASMTTLYAVLTRIVIPGIELVPVDGYVRVFTRLMAPAFCMFLLAFYGVFHCLLNAEAEALRYAERDFYRDWWHSADFGEWTRKWNSAVQDWIAGLYSFLRHSVGLPRAPSLILAIIGSGAWHDFVLAVAFRRLSFWTMIFMSLQIFLIQFARTGPGAALHKAVGPVIVLLMLPLGFSLLATSMGTTLVFCEGPVCSPFDLIQLSGSQARAAVVSANATVAV